MDIWFISDTHFGHTNMIAYENRPFSSTEQMNEVLIENWNKCVKPNDIIYHLGDIFLCSVVKEKEIASRLNGNKKLFLGNHDKATLTHYEKLGFNVLCDRNYSYYDDFKYKDFNPALMHRPIFINNRFVIHGHVHSNISEYEKTYPNSYRCVSVENIGYKPIHIDEILK